MRPVALITGASSGLGRGLALRAASEGWSVGLVARRAELLESLAEEIRREGGRALPLPADVSDRVGVREAVERCVADLGPVELAVANAGISEMTRPEELDAAQVERVMRVNFLGSVYLVEAVLPDMLERGRGRLVAVSSLAGYGGLPLTAAYSASKGAMSNFFESLRIDLRDTGVTVTVLAPGYVRTPMTDRNRHAMPFLLELDDAVDRMWSAMEKGARSRAFPVPLAALVRTARLFPRGLYDWIASRAGREKAE